MSDLTPIAALYVLLFQVQGITHSGISWLLMILSIAVLLLEVPTGALADRIDRRTVLWYSRLLKASCFFLWLFFPTPVGFGVGFFLWGAGTAMESGCWQAFLYDELKALGQQDVFRRILASLFSVSLVATLLSALLGSWLFATFGSYEWILIISGASAIAAGFVARTFPRASRQDATALPSWKSQWKESVGLFARRADAAWLLMTAALMGGIKGSLDEYHGLLFIEKNLTPEVVPLIYAGMTLVAALVFFLISKSPQRSTMPRLNGAMLGTGLFLFIVFFLPAAWVVVVLFGMVVFDSLFRVHNEALLQETIPADGARSTITSLASFGTELVALFVFLIASLLTAWLPLGMLYIGGGILLAAIPLIPRSVLRWGFQRFGNI